MLIFELSKIFLLVDENHRSQFATQFIAVVFYSSSIFQLVKFVFLRCVMDQKNIFLSALGVGVGVGIGLASGQTVSKWTSSSSNAVTVDIMEQEMLNTIVDGRDSKVTFDEFPYYLR